MSGGHIGLKLLVPCGGVKLRKPVTEEGKLLTGELVNSGFDLLNTAHANRINSYEPETSVEDTRRLSSSTTAEK